MLLQIRDEPAAVNATGSFSVTDKSIALKSLTLHSHLGNAEATGNVVFTPVLRSMTATSLRIVSTGRW